MLNLIPHVIGIAIIIVGTHLAAQALIHEFVDEPSTVFSKLTPFWQRWSKPLCYCPTCMASIHGTFWHFYFDGGVYYWIPTVLALAFVNTLFNKWVN